MMKAFDHMIFAVDDDPRMREALSELLTSMSFQVVVCQSAAEYLRLPKPDLPTCLILDLRLPDIDGLELQSQLAGQGQPAIVFITGHGDIPSSVRAIKAGAIDFLPKPFDCKQLVAAVQEGLARDARVRAEQAELAKLRGRLSKLTPRESEVLPWLVAGYLNKQSAAVLGISEITLQIHRGKIMRKMEAGSLAELVRMAATLQVSLPASHASSHMKSL